MLGMREEDRTYACEELQKIQSDLAFAAIEAYQERRLEDFASALILLRDFVEVQKMMCGPH